MGPNQAIYPINLARIYIFDEKKLLIENIIKSMSMIGTYIFDWWKTSKVKTGHT